MKLFEIDVDYTVKINKPWIGLIPEFEALIKRDKGSPGDGEGRNKLKARREFTFIYFYHDFGSPLRQWSDEERWKESLVYAKLTNDNIDEKVINAMKVYENLALKAARSLRTLKSIYKGMDRMDTYFETADFSATDKMGRLIHSTDSFIKNVQQQDNMYKAVESFEKRVEEELSGSSGIRGTATKGENEDKVKQWNEDEIREGSKRVAAGGSAGGPDSRGRTMMSLASIVGRGKDTSDDEGEDDSDDEDFNEEEE